MASSIISSDYLTFLSQIKEKIRTAQLRAALAVNIEVIHLYWYIGKQIIVKQHEAKWGSKFIDTLSLDLQNSFPETSGFSGANLKRMRRFDEANEREIEHASIPHITKFLLELGKGFAFVGRQVLITLEDSEYFIDMLFYHLKLHCYVVIELKATKFKPEHAGQLNFYLNLVDDFIKTDQDNPSIGLLLCKSRNKFVAEYALKGIEKPIGVSEYQLTKAIPEKLKTNLPTIQEIEAELNQEIEDK